jgi:glycosyltransferase involved in cell wall biosynthesis
MHINIILEEPYPHGMACTNRIHNYARGISELGGNVKILIPKPTENDTKAKNKTVTGKYEDIDFEYTCGTTLRGKTFIKRRLLVLKGIIKATKVLLKSRHKLDALLLVSNSLGYILYFKIVTNLLRIKYFQEKSEFPFVNEKMNFLLKIYAYIYCRYVYMCFDGIIVISKSLYAYFSNRIKKGASLLLVPIIVDLDEYTNPGKITQNDNIAYCGTLYEKKDGILILIEAFKRISSKYRNSKLYIIGDSHNSDKDKIRKLIKHLQIEDRVILTGYVSRERLKELLSNAAILALAKPYSKQAESCFPSKLGEYLATGNPVVVTKTGEIPDYLTDRKTAFLAEPDSVIDLATKLDYVLSNPELAKKVGIEGRKVALKHFNYKNQAKRIVNFIEQMNEGLRGN